MTNQPKDVENKNWGVFKEEDHIAVIPINEYDLHEPLDCTCHPRKSITDEDGNLLPLPVVVHNYL